MSNSRDPWPGRPADTTTLPTIDVRGEKLRLPTIEEAERLANSKPKSDEVLAREYALMMDAIYMRASEMDPVNCAPDRRFIKGDREAWVYDHGNIAELVFVR